MRINDAPISTATRKVCIERSTGEKLEFTVHAISVGTRIRFDKMYPRPHAPVVVTETKNGRTETPRYDDPAFVAAIEERDHLRNMYLIYSVLCGDKSVKFDNIPTDVASLRKLAVEIEESGLSEGDILVILKEAMAASNFTREEIAAGKASF